MVVRFPPRKGTWNAGSLDPWVEGLLEENKSRSELVLSEEGLAFIQSTLKVLERAPQYPQLVTLADQLAQGEEWKLELFLDLALLWARKQATWESCQRGLKLARLRSLLERQPNRKLLSLVAVEAGL